MSDEPKLDLDAIEARANAVAECSWEPRDDWNWARAVTNTAQKLRRDLNISTSARLPFIATFDKTSDAQFFVQARVDLLALVRRVRDLEELNRILATDAESAETERAKIVAYLRSGVRPQRFAEMFAEDIERDEHGGVTPAARNAFTAMVARVGETDATVLASAEPRGSEEPLCAGEWIAGSGLHRKHNPCGKPATWTNPEDPLAYCDEHITAQEKALYHRRESAAEAVVRELTDLREWMNGPSGPNHWDVVHDIDRRIAAAKERR